MRIQHQKLENSFSLVGNALLRRPFCCRGDLWRSGQNTNIASRIQLQEELIASQCYSLGIFILGRDRLQARRLVLMRVGSFYL